MKVKGSFLILFLLILTPFCLAEERPPVEPKEEIDWSALPDAPNEVSSPEAIEWLRKFVKEPVNHENDPINVPIERSAADTVMRLRFSYVKAPCTGSTLSVKGSGVLLTCQPVQVSL